MKKLLALVSGSFVILAGCAAGEASPDEVTTADDVGEVESAVTSEATVRIKSTINTSGSGKCVDVASGRTAIGTPIVQFRCHGASNQRFFLTMVTFGGAYQLRSELDRTKCIGVSSPTDHATLSLMACRDANGLAPLETRWALDGSDLQQPVSHAALRSLLPSRDGRSRCVDVAGGSANDSLMLQLYGCHGGANQRWELTNM